MFSTVGATPSTLIFLTSSVTNPRLSYPIARGLPLTSAMIASVELNTIAPETSFLPLSPRNSIIADFVPLPSVRVTTLMFLFSSNLPVLLHAHRHVRSVAVISKHDIINTIFIFFFINYLLFIDYAFIVGNVGKRKKYVSVTKT